MDARDEHPHPVGTDRAWSESYYFNFCDPASQVGMVARMAFRPNDGWADGLGITFLGGNRVAFNYARAEVDSQDELRVGPLSFGLSDPFKHWRLEFEGTVRDMSEAALLMAPRGDRPDGWSREANLSSQLDWVSLGDPFYSSRGRHGHFEQVGRLQGRIAVDGSVWTADGFGVRDKSWGPRTWQSADVGRPEKQLISSSDAPSPFIVWFSANFGPKLAIGGAASSDGRELGGSGWLLRDGDVRPLQDLRVHPGNYRRGSILHNALVVRATAADGGPLELAGEVLAICPTRVKTSTGTTYINEGLTRFSMDGQVGYGISEYHHATVAPAKG